MRRSRRSRLDRDIPSLRRRTAQHRDADPLRQPPAHEEIGSHGTERRVMRQEKRQSRAFDEPPTTTQAFKVRSLRRRQGNRKQSFDIPFRYLAGRSRQVMVSRAHPTNNPPSSTGERETIRGRQIGVGSPLDLLAWRGRYRFMIAATRRTRGCFSRISRSTESFGLQFG